MKYIIIIHIIFFLATALLKGQQFDESRDITFLIEKYTEDEDADIETIIKDLQFYAEHPLNINSATENELVRLHLLSDFQIYSLLEYRSTTGMLLSVNELFYIPGIPKELVKDLMYFVTVDKVTETYSNAPSILSPISGQMRLRYEQKIENSDDDTLSESEKYAGSPLKVYSAINMYLGEHIDASILMEKDAGEDFFGQHNRNGFDYYSGFLKYSGNGWIHSMCIGDYHLEFGQGLQFWSTSSFGKSSNIYGLKKTGRMIKGNSSRNENAYLRGFAATFRSGNIYFTPFISSKRFDANVNDEDSAIYFTSFQETGLHRTPAELLDEDKGQEQLAGINMQWKSNNFVFGITTSALKFKNSYLPAEQVYSIHNYKGHLSRNISTDYSLFMKNMQFFGELGYGNHRLAAINGALLHITGDLAFSVIYRYYQAGYFARYENALSENSDARNEQGVMLGMECYLLSHLKISGYYDFYNFPWLSYNRDAPCHGDEYVLAAEYSVYEGVKIYLRHKSETKPYNFSDNLEIPILIDKKTSRTKLKVTCLLSRCIKVAGEFQWSRVQNDSTDNFGGYLAGISAKYKSDKIPVEIDARYSFCDIDDYEARLYSYERDFVYTYTSVMNYQRNQRLSLFLKYSINSFLSFWASYALSLPGEPGMPDIHTFKIQTDIRF